MSKFSIGHVQWLIIVVIAQQLTARNVVYQIPAASQGNLFPLTLIHVNDIHARFDETSWQTGTCKRAANQTCIGGYARVVGTVRTLQRTRSNPIYFNAGDNFAGTIWYTIGRWNVTSYLLNLHSADVMTLGNHEFDHGVEGVVPFLETIRAPMVLANVDVSGEPTLQGKFRKSIILTRDGRRIGIIGVINRFTYEVSPTRNIKFLEETAVVRAESLELKERGVDIVIVLSHCGLDTDYEIAAKGGPHIDVIVGSHSHSFLYTGSNPPGPDKPVDEYPVVITQSTGRKVLIVQASSFTKYVGDLTVYFDDAGEVVNWRGAPIFMGPNIQPDTQILAAMEPWKKMFDAITMRSVGFTNKTISGSTCHSGECEMGNLLTDVYRQYYISQNNSLNDKPVIALVIAGEIRSSLSLGRITYGDLISVQPFGNSVDSIELTGQHLIDAFEFNAKRAFSKKLTSNLLQVAGARITYNRTNPIGQRVVSLEVECDDCALSSMKQYEPVDRTKVYRVVAFNYIINGGDGFTILTKNKQNHRIGPLDLDMLTEYIQNTQTIQARIEGRITIMD